MCSIPVQSWNGMTELLTAARMRALEAAAIATGQVTGLELMERAGRGVVAAVLAEWPELATAPQRAVVLCGPGNNGGDGFVVARLLKARGWEVDVFLYGDPDKLPPDARANGERWRAMGRVAALDDRRDGVVASLGGRQPALVVDALFGTGLTRPPGGDLDRVLARVSRCRDERGGTVPWVAVDVPSGLCADSGRNLGCRLPCDLTVTFHARKAGHLLAEGPRLCGAVRVIDIGLRRDGDDSLVEVGAPRRHLGKEAGHKFRHGHALVLSGPATRTGAARLAARAALRIGAGVVTVGAPAGALAEHAARLDAVMLREMGDGAALAGVLQDARITALCLGPGLGLDDRAAGLVAAALGPPAPGPTRARSRADAPDAGGDPGSGPGRGLVLDADALTLLARDPALFGALPRTCVLTPHGGEFARLFPDIAARLAEPATRGPAYSKVDATREAAARAGCVVLHKGPDTVIADPAGRAAVNAAAYERAAPWLATAGSGDVLAGFIAGLMARGFPPFDAACTAAWLHVDGAVRFGPGLIAEDLPEMLPQVFRALGL
jgi:hydroxyethylthiazole kinase-like uncharacterized protein yjeF